MEVHCPFTSAKKLNVYLSDTANRDRITSLVQFASQAVVEPARKAGLNKVAADAVAINTISGQYRAITRISQWLNVAPEMLHPLRTIELGETHLIGYLKLISTTLFSVFLLGEEMNLCSKLKILPPSVGKSFNRVRFVFLFWSNLVRTTMMYLIYRRSNFDAKTGNKNSEEAIKHEKKKMACLDGFLQLMFVYGLLKGSSPCGVLTVKSALKSGKPLDLIASLAPPFFPIPTTIHGILGIIAALPLLRASML